MFKTILFLALLSFTLNAGVLNFYKNALQTLRYKQTYSLYKQADEAKKEGIIYNRFSNFALDADYADTKAKQLPQSFNTTNIAVTDTIDLFGKSSYKIEELALDIKAKQTLLDIQKEQLFVSLVSMISIYNQTKERLSLHQSLLNEQQNIYDKLQILQIKGSVSQIDLLRFKNILVQLKTKMIDEQTTLEKMKKQLNLYAPNQNIPNFENSKYLYTKEDFLFQNKQEKLGEISAKQLLAQAKTYSHSYLPDFTVGVNYQKLDDPTSYGDNYSVSAAIHMPINSNDFKQSEALRINALSMNSKNAEYKIQRENEYNQRFQDYQNAENQLIVLNKNLDNYSKSKEMIKTAYLKQYVDFNTYLQVLTESVNAKEQIIGLTFLKNEQVTILNAIASGAIYE